jgi:hypothetical protein
MFYGAKIDKFTNKIGKTHSNDEKGGEKRQKKLPMDKINYPQQYNAYPIIRAYNYILCSSELKYFKHKQ